MIFIDAGSIQYLPLNNARRQVIFQENGSGVKDVMIGGNFVLRNRVPTGVDYHSLREKVTTSAIRIGEMSAEKKPLVDQLEPLVNKFCVGLSNTELKINRYIAS